MFQVGQTAVWHRVASDLSRVDAIRVKIVKIGRNGITVEAPLENGGTRKVRVARDSLRPPKPPAKPLVRCLSRAWRIYQPATRPPFPDLPRAAYR